MRGPGGDGVPAAVRSSRARRLLLADDASTIRAWLRTPAPSAILAARPSPPSASPRSSPPPRRPPSGCALETEERVKHRIAEAQRAADNRVRAAEEEASTRCDWRKPRRRGCARVRRGRRRGGQDRRHQRGARDRRPGRGERRRRSSRGARVRRGDASRGRGACARPARGRPRHRRRRPLRGLELVSNLREMSNSLRANAERLLGDVQRVHSSLAAQIARVERAAGSGSPVRVVAAPRVLASSGRRRCLAGDDGLDVPSSSRRADRPASVSPAIGRFSVRSPCEHRS